MKIMFFQILEGTYPLKKIFLGNEITIRPSNKVLTWALIFIDPHFIKPDTYLLAEHSNYYSGVLNQEKILESPGLCKHTQTWVSTPRCCSMVFLGLINLSP